MGRLSIGRRGQEKAHQSSVLVEGGAEVAGGEVANG